MDAVLEKVVEVVVVNRSKRKEKKTNNVNWGLEFDTWEVNIYIQK